MLNLLVANRGGGVAMKEEKEIRGAGHKLILPPNKKMLQKEIERLGNRLTAAEAFCDAACEMDSFDEHPLLLAWKEARK